MLQMFMSIHTYNEFLEFVEELEIFLFSYNFHNETIMKMSFFKLKRQEQFKDQ